MNLRITILLSFGALLIVYLSLRSSPQFSELSWLPDWLGIWADQHGDLRTGVPFFILSTWLALEAWWAFRVSRALPNMMWILAVYGLIGLLGLTEFIQIWLPDRSACWGDIAWGSIGTIAGGWPLLLRSVWPRAARSESVPSEAKRPNAKQTGSSENV